VRACLDWLKRKERSTVPFSTLGPDFRPDDVLEANSRIDGPVWDQDDCRQLMAAVEALPEKYRQVLMLYYYQDVTYEEIAALLGLSRATINARLTKARMLLRERLSKCPR
jgi:RNA polymerase sigma factor (sigma-70 family)